MNTLLFGCLAYNGFYKDLFQVWKVGNKTDFLQLCLGVDHWVTFFGNEQRNRNTLVQRCLVLLVLIGVHTNEYRRSTILKFIGSSVNMSHLSSGWATIASSCRLHTACPTPNGICEILKQFISSCATTGDPIVVIKRYVCGINTLCKYL